MDRVLSTTLFIKKRLLYIHTDCGVLSNSCNCSQFVIHSGGSWPRVADPDMVSGGRWCGPGLSGFGGEYFCITESILPAILHISTLNMRKSQSDVGLLHIRTPVAVLYAFPFPPPLPSNRQHLSYDVCLEVRGEIIRTVLCCIVYWSCAQS